MIEIKIKNNEKMALLIRTENIEKKTKNQKSLLLKCKNFANPQQRKLIFELLKSQEHALNLMQEIVNLDKF